jgi:hypothetical protein
MSSTVYTTFVGEEVEGESRPLRYHENPDKLTTFPHEEVTTSYELLKYCAAKRPNMRAVGTRPLVDVRFESSGI